VKPGPLVFAAGLVIYGVVRRRRISRGEWILGAIVFAALLVYGTGLVHPPSIETLIKDAGEKLGKWTYLLVGALAFLETGAFVGLIAPGEFTILVGGVVAGQGRIDLMALIALVWVCAVAGDLTSYFLGRRLGRGFMERHGPKVKITHARLEQVQSFFDRHGGKAILIGRFVGLVRAVAPFLAGSSRMPLRRFIPYDVVGAGLWGTTFVVLGYIFWHSFDQVASIAKKGALALGFAIALGFGIYAAVKWLRVEGNRERAVQWIEGQPLLRPLLPIARRVRRPLVFAWNRLTPGELGLELTTLLMVGGIGWFVFIGYWHIFTIRRFTIGDMRAMNVSQDLNNGTGVAVAKVVTTLGSLPATGSLVLVTALVLAARRRVAEALALAAGMALTVWAVHWAKDLVDRPRPLHPLVSAADQSYPSGHAAYAIAYIAAAIAIGHMFPRFRGRVAVVSVAVGLAVLIGITRIYLRAHFFSDVIGGYGLAFGLFALTAIIALVVVHLRQNEAAT
jgi:membrane protein DedA with SNARE-associated domain/membrane-associated phospholipid phosphatase